jgi:hypothetical protein
LENDVADVARGLGLEAQRKVKVGRRLWGSVREIDVVLTDPSSRRRIGIECKRQQSRGTAEEKLPAVIQDVQSWPIDGLLVFDGAGFSQNIKAFLYSTGKAVELGDLEDWLRLYFGFNLQ